MIFVGSARGATTGGELHSVTTSGATLVSSGQLAVNSTTGIADAPIVDSTTEKVYAFVGEQVGNTNAAVYQFAANFAGGSVPTTVAALGSSSTATDVVYAGTFDNTYYTGAGTTGNLYAWRCITAQWNGGCRWLV